MAKVIQMNRRERQIQRRETPPSSRDRIREAAKALFAKTGYESATTADICRVAGTSQSQLIKHFGNKQGLIEAVFQHAWAQITPAVALAIEKVPSPRDKLKLLADMVLSFLDADKEMRTLFLLEGRRIRGDGRMVVLVPGFWEFVELLDGIVQEAAASGQLRPDINVQAFRSTLMGAIEGMLRDQMLARTCKFPATYSAEDIRRMFDWLLSSVTPQRPPNSATQDSITS